MMAWVHEVVAHYSLLFGRDLTQGRLRQDYADCRSGRAAGAEAVCERQRPDGRQHLSHADREKPSMMFDNVDTLFQRKPEVTELFLNGWTRGIKVPRAETH